MDDKLVGVGIAMPVKYKLYLKEHGGITHNILEMIKEKIEKGDSIGVANTKEKSFLFSKEATNEEIYSYLRSYPEAAEYLYQKYSANKDFIKDLCDPKNPIYIEKVGEQLKNIIIIESKEKDLSTLMARETKLKQEITLLGEELEQTRNEKEKEEIELQNKITQQNSELVTLTSKLQLLSTIEAIKFLTNLFTEMDRISEQIGNQFQITGNQGWNSREVLISTSSLRTIKDGLDKLRKLMDSNELIPQELVDKRRLERDRENQELLRTTKYAIDHNIIKVHKRLTSNLTTLIKQLDGENEIKNATSVRNIVEYLTQSVKLIEAWEEDLPGVLTVVK